MILRSVGRTDLGYRLSWVSQSGNAARRDSYSSYHHQTEAGDAAAAAAEGGPARRGRKKLAYLRGM